MKFKVAFSVMVARAIEKSMALLGIKVPYRM
jgi:arginyl-tRNA synthetase